MTPTMAVVNALEAHGCRPQERGGKYRAHCPTHDDKTPSLTVGEGADGRALIHCWAGCRTSDIVAELGLQMADLFTPADVFCRTGDWTF